MPHPADPGRVSAAGFTAGEAAVAAVTGCAQAWVRREWCRNVRLAGSPREKPMRVIVVRHHAIDDAGMIAAAFAARGAELTMHQFPADGPLPPLDDVDHVIVLGAVWSVYDEQSIGHWIGDELDWIRAADSAGVPVLGICFGAQALTTALGGVVKAAP